MSFPIRVHAAIVSGVSNPNRPQHVVDTSFTDPPAMTREGYLRNPPRHTRQVQKLDAAYEAAKEMQ